MKRLHSNREFEYYDLFHTSVITAVKDFYLFFSARGALKMATQTKLQKYFRKHTQPATKQIQTKVSRFLKCTKEKNNNEVIYVGGKCLHFRVWKN